jgi:hypothetical protein
MLALTANALAWHAVGIVGIVVRLFDGETRGKAAKAVE